MSRHSRIQVVRTYECDRHLKMRPETILRWMEDIAEEHASTLGFGYDMCAAQSLAWVEIKLAVVIHRMPAWKEEVHVSTWTHPLNAAIADREFRMTDKHGNLLIESATQWVLIDVERRRPVALKKHLPDFPEHQNHATDMPCMDDLPALNSGQSIASCTAGQSTVDFNQHVNNSFYLVWALDSLNEEDRNRIIREIRIDFKKESMPGERLDIAAESDSTSLLLSLSCAGADRARIRLSWS